MKDVSVLYCDTVFNVVLHLTFCTAAGLLAASHEGIHKASDTSKKTHGEANLVVRDFAVGLEALWLLPITMLQAR